MRTTLFYIWLSLPVVVFIAIWVRTVCNEGWQPLILMGAVALGLTVLFGSWALILKWLGNVSIKGKTK